MANGALTLEEGVVFKKVETTAWIKTTKTGACSGCSAKGSCHTLGGGKEMEVEAINTAGAEIGDRVVIGFQTSSLLKASFLLYILPILGLITGAAIGQGAGPMIGLNASSASPAAGFLFFALAFLFVRKKGSQLSAQTRYQPRVVRILGTTERCPLS